MVGAKFPVKSNREFFGANREVLGVETGNLRAEIQTGVEGAVMVEKHYEHLAPSYIVAAIRAGAPRT
jgi:hypothetical protein